MRSSQSAQGTVPVYLVGKGKAADQRGVAYESAWGACRFPKTMSSAWKEQVSTLVRKVLMREVTRAAPDISSEERWGAILQVISKLGTGDLVSGAHRRNLKAWDVCQKRKDKTDVKESSYTCACSWFISLWAWNEHTVVNQPQSNKFFFFFF